MRRIFTLSLALVCLLVISFNSYAQTSTCSTSQSTNNTGTYKIYPASQSFLGGQNDTLTTPSYTTSSSLTTLNFYIKLEQVGNNAQTILTPSIIVRYYDINNVLQTAKCTPTNGSFTPTAGAVQQQNFSITLDPAIGAGKAFQVQVAFTSTGNRTVNISEFGIETTGTTLIEGTAAIILPVHFSKVAVQKASEGALVTWAVGTEQNVSGYDVEKSIDGRSFTKIGFVAAQGLSTYSFADAKAGAVNFYRIKSVDLDGRYNFSTVVVLNNGTASVVVKAFMSDKNTLTVQHDAAQAGSCISVVSMDGRVVKMQQPSAGAQQTTVDLSSAQTGLYIIRYDNGQGGTQSIKVAK